MPPEKKKQRESELRASIDKLAEIVKSTNAGIVLIPGDLFDRESVDNDLVNHVAGVFAALPPVFITPGNHDYTSPGSPYSNEQRTRRGLVEWPENVYIFEDEDFATRYLPGRVDVAVTGHAFRANVPVTEHRLAKRIPRDPAEISILLLHGSRTQFAFEESQKLTLPFTAGELLAQGFSYAALGHYHTYSEIVDGPGSIRGLYGGRPFAAENGSDGLGCISGVISKAGATELERHSLDSRKTYEITVVCDNVATPEEMKKLAAKAYQESGAGAYDLARYNFCGTYLPGFSPKIDIDPEWHFASAVNFSHLRPGYDLQGLLEGADGRSASAESLFARELVGLIEQAEDEEREILEDALDYGLRALHGLDISPREVD